MGLHDRLSRTDQGGTPELRLAHSEESRPSPAHDPYAELKTRVHHAVIATLGAELFKQEANQDLLVVWRCSCNRALAIRRR